MAAGRACSTSALIRRRSRAAPSPNPRRSMKRFPAIICSRPSPSSAVMPTRLDDTCSTAGTPKAGGSTPSDWRTR
jgi:hypothetical protein